MPIQVEGFLYLSLARYPLASPAEPARDGGSDLLTTGAGEGHVQGYVVVT